MAYDYVRYANQGATRSQPLNQQLISAMSFLPEMGLTMEVHSGGQDAEGPNRTGSTRHDHGGAGDVDFITADGRRLSASNPNDQAILAQVIARAKANGVTGFGQGADYMGDTRIHLGYGNPGVWGADGKSANAPEWLRTAYSGTPQGNQQTGNDTMAALGLPNNPPQGSYSRMPVYDPQGPQSRMPVYDPQGPQGMMPVYAPQGPRNALERLPPPQLRNALMDPADFMAPVGTNALTRGMQKYGRA
tara:strand:- start:2 stop:739 length:738 start_codon:yes stop_codon:yes gene_type:complete